MYKLAKRISLMLISLLVIIVIFVEVKFNHIKTQNYHEVTIYKHRGGQPDNNFKAISRSIAKGWKYLELDFFYENGHFYLTHDYVKPLTQFKTLEELIKKIKKKDVHLWIDLKNLTSENAGAIGDRLAQLNEQYDFSERYEVESTHAVPLFRLKLKKIRVLYWVNPYMDKSLFWVRNFSKRAKIVLLGLHNISFDQQYYIGDFRSMICGLKTHIFTVNGSKLEVMKEDECISAIITDESFDISHLE